MFFVSAIAFGVISYKPVSELLDDTLGSVLRQREWDRNLEYERQAYIQISREQGERAAIEYKRTPKAVMHTGPSQVFKDWQWAITVGSLLFVMVVLYHLIWKFGVWALRYVVHGSKAGQ